MSPYECECSAETVTHWVAASPAEAARLHVESGEYAEPGPVCPRLR